MDTQIMRKQTMDMQNMGKQTVDMQNMGKQTISLVKNGQEILVHVETNHLGQVKMASLSKTGKYIWVNVKQYKGILKRRLARLKCSNEKQKHGQRLHKQVKKQKDAVKMCPPPHLGGESHLCGSSNFADPVIYSPTSTPLAWCPDLYVQELLRAKKRLELLEAKEQES